MSEPPDSDGYVFDDTYEFDEQSGGDPDDDPARERDRLVGQIDVVLNVRSDAAVHPTRDEIMAGEDLQYIYRTGRILFRDADLARIQPLVTGYVVDSMIVGVTAYEILNTDVQTALERIDSALGKGVATPDHFLWATSTCHCCPAAEPLPTERTSPYPGIRTGALADGTGVSVSVVDTGFISGLATDGRHRWIQGVTGDEETFTATDMEAYAGHGTFIAGIVRCMAPQSEVRVEGFLTTGAVISPSGNINNLTGGALTETEIVAQMYDSMAAMPDIISMSAGCTTRDRISLLAFDVFYENRLRHIKAPVIVVAAGNDSRRIPYYPAAYDWTVSVGALNRAKQRAVYSRTSEVGWMSTRWDRRSSTRSPTVTTNTRSRPICSRATGYPASASRPTSRPAWRAGAARRSPPPWSPG